MNKRLLGLFVTVIVGCAPFTIHATPIELTSTDPPLLISSHTENSSDIVGPDSLPHYPNYLDVEDLKVSLTLKVGDVRNIYISFYNTVGEYVALFDGGAAGASGANFINTTFDDDALNPISDGTAPFSGSFLPSEPFSPLEGTNIGAGGNWRLRIANLGDTDATLERWSVSFSTVPEPTITTILGIGFLGIGFARRRVAA